MSAKLPQGTLDALWADSAHWRLGVFYSCPDDPRVIVPKRPRWAGWTMNFAHAGAWGALALIAAGIAVPAVLMALAGWTGSLQWFAALAGIVAVVIVCCARAASPRRYERPPDPQVPQNVR